MEKNLETLLQKVQMEENLVKDFEGGKLLKIVGNASKTKYCFYLTLKNTLPFPTYQKLLEQLPHAFSEISVLHVQLQVEHSDLEQFPYYFRYFIEQYSKNSPLLKMFLENEYHIEENLLTIVVGNRAEQIKLEGILSTLEVDLHSVGYPYTIKCQVDMEQESMLQAEIESDMVSPIPEELLQKTTIEEKEEPKKRFIPKDYKRPPLIVDTENEKVVVGRFIDEPAIRLDTVNTPKSSVVVEAAIFGKDVRETKTGLKIISLKITDNTDSIYGTLFVNDPDEFELIDKKIKIGKWYKIRAIVKDVDKYMSDISLTIRDMNMIDKVIEEVVDDAEVKRVE